MATPTRYIDRLLAIAGTDRKVYKEVTIKGQDFSFYMTPMTLAEQQSATKMAKSDDANDFALQLLVNKALDENGQKLLQVDALPLLRNSIEKAEVDKLLLALIENTEEEEVAPVTDLKSVREAA